MTDRSEELTNILLELAADSDVSPEAVRLAMAEHPHHAMEIAAFALEWHLDQETDARDDVPLPGADLARLWRDAAVCDPFDGKSPQELKSLAQQLDLPIAILRQICRRMIDAATIPLILIGDIARHLRVETGALFGYLELEPSLANTEYRSSQPPQALAKISFATAVRITPMSDELREKWLTLAG
jgi:hypothetical protein